jgi:hypothetical protein
MPTSGLLITSVRILHVSIALEQEDTVTEAKPLATAHRHRHEFRSTCHVLGVLDMFANLLQTGSSSVANGYCHQVDPEHCEQLTTYELASGVLKF